MMENPGIDVILPIYRPKPGWEEHVRDGLAALTGHFGKIGVPVRFYLVNDGSEAAFFPETVLEEFQKVAPGFHFLSYEQNHGKGYSLRYGVARARQAYQVYTDGDFPFGWESVIRAYEELAGGADVVMGVRGRDYATVLPPMRKVLSRGERKLNSLILGLPAQFLDTQAGLKGFNRTGRDAFLATRVETFLFDTEFIFVAWNRRLKLATVNLSLREGLHFSRMGTRVMLRELRHLVRIFVRHKLFAARRKREYEHGKTVGEKR